jgi:hypothetical protein
MNGKCIEKTTIIKLVELLTVKAVSNSSFELKATMM